MLLDDDEVFKVRLYETCAVATDGSKMKVGRFLSGAKNSYRLPGECLVLKAKILEVLEVAELVASKI